MALIKCNECGREVSDKAASCPNCGAPIAAQPPAASAPKADKKKGHIGCLPTLIVIFATLWLIGTCSQPDPGPPPSPEAEAAAAAAHAQVEESCRKSLQCWGDRHSAPATVRCARAVEREAKYQAEWTDGWGEPKFPRFGWGDEEKGTIRYGGDKVKFQNGFGAWQHMIYICEFDPATQQVIRVSVTPRG